MSERPLDLVIRFLSYIRTQLAIHKTSFLPLTFDYFSGQTPVAYATNVVYFTEVYYPGETNYTFHFLDPPGGQRPLPLTIEGTNRLADGTALPATYMFSLLLNPNGTLNILSVSDNMTLTHLSGPLPVPEASTTVSLLTGIGVLALLRQRRKR